MNPVIYRAYVKGVLEACTPFSTHAARNMGGDVDMIILKDADGNPFLPGSSLAGVLRSVFDESELVAGLFGTRIKNNGDNCYQSSIITYDCFLSKNCNPSYAIRDGVRLNYGNKTAVTNAKYDYEVVESGACFDFKLELVVRKEINGEIYHLFDSLIDRMEKGISLGSKTSRGLGLFVLKNVKIYEVSGDNAYSRYVNFDWNNEESFTIYSDSAIKKCDRDKTEKREYVEIKERRNELIVKINFPGTVLIRDYSEKDVIMLKSNGLPVIPGTSWAGLFRHESRRVLTELVCDERGIDMLINEMFGTDAEQKIEDKKMEHADKSASKVMFSETKISGAVMFKQTNVKIDRFTQGAADGALYDAEVSALGTAKLIIKYPNNEKDKWMEDLLKLVLADLNDGLIAIGGQTSIGRGLCKIENFIPSKGESLYKKLMESGLLQPKEAAI